MTEPATLDAILDRARTGYEHLVALAEDVEDEWSYVGDLADAWRARLDEVGAARGQAIVEASIGAAVEALVAEAARISDPHRAIDWLSTYPQVLLVALGERP
jgi:hypothetical protein